MELFPAISVNQYVTVISNCSLHVSQELWGNSGCENTRYLPQIAEIYIKGIISMRPNSCISPYIAKCQTSGDSNLLIFRLPALCCKVPIYPSFPSLPQSRFSELSKMLSPRLQSLFCPQRKLKLQLSFCAFFLKNQQNSPYFSLSLYIWYLCVYTYEFPWWLSDKESTCNAGDASLIPGSPRGGNGNPLQYSCLGNPMDRAASGL